MITTKTQIGNSYIIDIVLPNDITGFLPTAYYGIAPCMSSSFDNFNYEFICGFKNSSYFANMDSEALLANIMSTATLDVVYVDDGIGNYEFVANCNVLGFVHKYNFIIYVAGQPYITFITSSPFVSFKIPTNKTLYEIGMTVNIYLEDDTTAELTYGNLFFTNQYQTGVSDIKNHTIQTQSGISRIVFIQHQTGISNIQTPNISRYQLGRSDILVVQPQIQLGVADINKNTIQTQSGMADIDENTRQTQLGVADINKNTIQTQLGQSNMLGIQTQLGVADINKNTIQTQLGLADID